MDDNTRGIRVIVCTYVSLTVSAVFVSLRLYVRWRLVKVVGREDACIFLAWLVAFACAITMHLNVTMGGLGQRLDTLTPAHIIMYFKMQYVSIICYNTSLSLSKFGILLFCQRLFALSSWKRLYPVVLTCIGIYTFWVVGTSIMPCIPVCRFWNRTVQGTCLNDEILWFVNAGLNIFTDFLVALLPIPTIFTLRLPMKQKIGVGMVFALGLFVCIISIIRLKSISRSTTAIDFTHDSFDIALWTCIEVNGAIVGACLPMLKPLVNKVWPAFLSSGRPGDGYVIIDSGSKKDAIRLETLVAEEKGFGSVEGILGVGEIDGAEESVREGKETGYSSDGHV